MEFEISLTDLRFYAYHGVMDEEKAIGNEFRVDLTVVIPSCDAIEEDKLEHTVSYADLYEIIAETMSKPRNLLEKVALNIVREIKNRFSEIRNGWIRIEKTRPPIQGMLGSASVKLKF